MSPQLKIDVSQWRQAAAELFKTSSRELEDFINGQALKVSIEAIRNTEKANTAQIAHQLGQIGTSLKEVKSRKTGRIEKRRGTMIVKEDSYAERILATRKKLTGSWGFKAKTIEEAVRKFIARSVQTVAFIKSGWIPSRTALFRVVKKKPTNATRVADAKQHGKPKGYAIPARFSWTKAVQSIIANTALKDDGLPPSRTHNPMPVAEAGLSKAMQIARLDMMNELARRLQPGFNRASAK